MYRKLAALALALVAGTLVACGGRGTGQSALPMGGSVALPQVERDLAMSAVLPAHTIGEELPNEGLGNVRMGYWGVTVGGFTQTQYSQTLAFPVGTKITIRNLSKMNAHTLDVVKQITGHRASFPGNPPLPTSAHGHGILAVGYASGVIQPGHSVTVTLSKAGTYLIGCAFHYGFGMRDVLIVTNHDPDPGPQASAPAGNPSPSPTSSGGGGGGGW
jgi:plastocyanin